MYLTIRRYEGVDTARSDEIRSKVSETLLPRLRKLPGFASYTLIDEGEGVITSVGLFDEAEQAHESTRVAARWLREQDLISAVPNSPKVSAGDVLLQELTGITETREAAVVQV
jgi:hypothetical protein